MKMENLTQEINSSLVIKSTKGFKFGNNKIQFETKGLGLYHPVLGFVSFSKDKYGINQPYIPQGGRKALQSVLDKGGLLEYDSVNFAKPIN